MKVRKHSKRRIANIRAMRKGTFSRAEHHAFALLLKGFESARFLKRKPVKLSLNATTVIWRPLSYVGAAL